MIPVVLWNTIEFKSPEQWSEFARLNLESHNAIAFSLGLSGDVYPRSQFLTQSAADQLAHWNEHVAIAQAQATQVPKLIELSFDPSNEDEFYDFLSYHAYYHEIQEQAQGLS